MRPSVVITDTDSPDIRGIVDRVAAQQPSRPELEILVVGSDAQGLARDDPRVSFLPTRETTAGDKRNAGVEASSGDVVLFLDDDCFPASDWLERHLDRHRRGEQIVGGAVTFDRSHYLQLADNVSAFHGFLPYLPAGPRPYLASANLSVRREVFARAGGFPTGWRRAEDLEWTLRCREQGYRLYFDPAALVHHRPRRYRWIDLWRHWTVDAPHTLRVRLRHAGLLGTPRLARYRVVFSWGAPLVALWATAVNYSRPRTWRLYAHVLPVVYLTKLAWCWGAARDFPAIDVDGAVGARQAASGT